MESENDGEEACSASKIGVSNYGVSMTTLEEVFLKLDDDSNNDKEGSFDNIAADESTHNLILDDGSNEPHLTTNGVQVNMVEFGSSSKSDWFSILWLQLTALLEVMFVLTTFFYNFCFMAIKYFLSTSTDVRFTTNYCKFHSKTGRFP